MQNRVSGIAVVGAALLALFSGQWSRAQSSVKGQPAMKLALRIAPEKLEGKTGDSFIAQVRLENQGAAPVAVQWLTDPLQYLDLEVTDSRGHTLPAVPFAAHFSPYSPTPQVLRLGPGRSYQSSINLLQHLKTTELAPGTYHVRGVWGYGGGIVRSNVVEVVIH